MYVKGDTDVAVRTFFWVKISAIVAVPLLFCLCMFIVLVTLSQSLLTRQYLFGLSRRTRNSVSLRGGRYPPGGRLLYPILATGGVPAVEINIKSRGQAVCGHTLPNFAPSTSLQVFGRVCSCFCSAL